MNYTDPKVLEALFQEFDYYREDKTEVWKIRLNGSFIRTVGGKSSWAKEHHARSGFRGLLKVGLQFIHTSFREQDPKRNFWQNRPTLAEIKDCINQLESAGILEFVRIL